MTDRRIETAEAARPADRSRLLNGLCYGTIERTKKKPVPTNKRLYSAVKAQVKRKFKVYPSAYANAFLVKEYKRRGGKYRMGVKK